MNSETIKSLMHSASGKKVLPYILNKFRIVEEIFDAQPMQLSLPVASEGKQTLPVVKTPSLTFSVNSESRRFLIHSPCRPSSLSQRKRQRWTTNTFSLSEP